MEKKRIGMLCVIAVVAVLLGTMWPFNPNPANHVQWVPDGNGVRFGHGGLVLSQSDLQAAPVHGATYGVTLEVWIRPARLDWDGTILSFYDAGNPQKLMLRQWMDSLLVTHEWSDAQGKTKTTKFDVDHAFQPERAVFVTIAFGPKGAVVYRNGTQGQLFRRFVVAPSDVAGQVVMGTSPVDWRPWQGEISGLAVYSTELTPAEVARHFADWRAGPSNATGRRSALARYVFNEHAGREIHSDPSTAPDLIIPRNFDVPHKGMLRSPIKEYEPTRNYLDDVVVNILGFMPLGAILCVYFSLGAPRLRAICSATLMGGLLSLTIEVLQAYIPSRGSGVTDIITNTTGALLGAVIVPTYFIRSTLRAVRRVPSEVDSALRGSGSKHPNC